MKHLHTLFLASLALGVAHAETTPSVTGAWKIAIGANAVCQVTLAEDGSATVSAGCQELTRVAKWEVVAQKLELETASGETVGVLYPKGDTYAGTRFSDGRKLVLSR